MGRLEGKVAIVTGAAGDLGTEIARRCAAEGASMILMDLADAGALAAQLGGADVLTGTDLVIDGGLVS
jgi:NAD(P)-dependent dehydrogenase (short-subunit alcohol dehydrogenase family)